MFQTFYWLKVSPSQPRGVSHRAELIVRTLPCTDKEMKLFSALRGNKKQKFNALGKKIK
jgi:hypothetical protein